MGGALQLLLRKGRLPAAAYSTLGPLPGAPSLSRPNRGIGVCHDPRPEPRTSAIERWYYKALHTKAGPVEALQRKIRSDHGQHSSLTPRFETY